MKVRLKTEVTGLRDGVPWPKVGGVIDLPDDEAGQLLAAKIVEPLKAAKPETATVAPVNIEKADAPAAPAAAPTPARRGRPPKAAPANK